MKQLAPPIPPPPAHPPATVSPQARPSFDTPADNCTIPDLIHQLTPEAETILKPIMGGITFFDSGSSRCAVPWTGGQPNATWTGLLDPPHTCVNPLRTRSTTPKSSSAFPARQAGLHPGEETRRFSRKHDLDHFFKKIKEALVEFGMDTISCRRDPADSTKTVDVLEDCAKLNQKAIKEESAWCVARFDSCDAGNDEQAKKFPLNSLDIELEKEITD